MKLFFLFNSRPCRVYFENGVDFDFGIPHRGHGTLVMHPKCIQTLICLILWDKHHLCLGEIMISCQIRALGLTALISELVEEISQPYNHTINISRAREFGPKQFPSFCVIFPSVRFVSRLFHSTENGECAVLGNRFSS